MRLVPYWMAAAALAIVWGQTPAGELRLPGEFQPVESASVRPTAPGFVARVLVSTGAVVKKGDVLVQMATLEASAAQAYSQSKPQAPDSAATQQAFAQAEASLRSVRGLTAPVSNAPDAANVIAPFDGIVREVWAQAGRLAGPSLDPLLRLESTRIRMVVHVPRAAAAGIAKGAQLQFSVPDRQPAASTAVVARIAPAGPTAKAIDVELDVDNIQGSFAPGMHPEVVWPVLETRAKKPPLKASSPASKPAKGAVR